MGDDPKTEVKGRIPILCQCHWPRSKSIPAWARSLPLGVFTTGYRHLASIISSETQSASKGQLRRNRQSSLFLTHRNSPWTHRPEAEPGGDTFQAAPHVISNHVGTGTPLRVLGNMQVHFTERAACSEMKMRGWKKSGDFFFFPPIAFHRDASQTERKTEECKKRAEKTKVAQKRKNTLSCSPVLPPLPNNIYASAFCPDRVMDSRGDFAWAWK